ncbi:Zn2/Cys6 DNA-binding protein [Glarea lozoyensis ATCC 20868]|uniref:Zn2/Cys6 DNA-binding protein n=1 Tax=Glarea lozoyensis (strain ATCC 20868 / MF5171) TaxID=1116229 RepID=S3CMN9_GLAL2|nr:Zn2/Cys6 DNA-binding protein [Glarea lozoyensis ATCC 20868]EPE26995.1 Zn2/Cys6 DNA-binding protein [Glarea lozoyensis ATCC 20868]
MPTPSSYHNVFRVAKPGVLSSDSSIPKRNRQSLSCTACKTRKTKCDRLQPCSSCVNRGHEDATSCVFSTGKPNRKRTTHDLDPKESTNVEAQLRLQKIEDMVNDLLHKSQQGSNESNNFPLQKSLDVQSPDSSTGGPGSHAAISSVEKGHFDIRDSGTRYFGATSWTAVLESIRDVKHVLDMETEDEIIEESLSKSPESLPPDLVFDTSQTLTIQELCASLPPRIVVDKLLSAYFNAKHNQGSILHSAKFLREYEAFWTNSSPKTFLWMSVLFSTLYIGSRVLEMSSQDLGVPLPDPDALVKKAGQALVAGKYQNGLPYSIEALLIYTTCKHMQDDDCEKNLWVLMGITARLTLRMGYHRDPKALPNISPFEGEMRRRVFSHVVVIDLLLSFQAGLPPVIQEDECDTMDPSNLLDTDFDEDCKVLPPSRPPSDPTTMLYYCEKSRMARLLRRAVRHALSLKNPPFKETMQIDREIKDAHLLVPQSLRMKPIGSSVVDEAYMILHRLNLELLYLRSTSVLHRKYLSYERSNPKYSISRATCLEAALTVLGYQADLHHACQPGGQLYNDRWMTSSLIAYDFLLAVMIICLELYESRNESNIDTEYRRKQYGAVKQAHEIWRSRSSVSKEAKRATTVIASLLSKVQEPIATDEARVTNTISTASEFSGQLLPLHPEVPSYSNYEDAANTITQPGHDLDSVFSASENIDWGFVDQYLIQHGNVNQDPSYEWQF